MTEQTDPDAPDPRITEAATRLVEAAAPLSLDVTPLLTDARFRRLFDLLEAAGVVSHEQLVDVEVAAIEETLEQVLRVRAELESNARRRSLLEGVPGVPPTVNGQQH